MMPVTDIRQILNSFPEDDAGTFGLHLGVLRAFAEFALTAPPRPIRPHVDR
jgi:hypothetical protein